MSRNCVVVRVVLSWAVAGALGSGCYVTSDKHEDPPPCDVQSGDTCQSAPDLGGSTDTNNGGTGGNYAQPMRATGGRTGNATGGNIAGGNASGGNVGGRNPQGGNASGGSGGSPYDPLAPAPPPATICTSTTTVSRFKELMIVDPHVVGDSRADDSSSKRPWSFRQRLEDLVPGAPEAAAAMADAWLAQWSLLTDVPVDASPGAPSIPVEPRPAAHDVLRCPWLHLSADNGCDATCSTCRSRRANLSRSPFRLLAIVNRPDLASGVARNGASACGASPAAASSGGELRFVYGATEPGSNRALPFTVIFEYGIALKAGETLRDWVATWHTLAEQVAGTTGYNARLDDLVARGLARATLRRVLTNEVAFGAAEGLPWEMRQFVPALTDAGTLRLVEVAMSGTPRLTLASSTDLGLWIDENATQIAAGDNSLPPAMLAATAPIPTVDFGWRTTARDPGVASAFNHNTCSGCHGGRTDPTDVPFQHVAPPRDEYYGLGTGPTATARLSRFLDNPGREDELSRRERTTAAILCGTCPIN